MSSTRSSNSDPAGAEHRHTVPPGDAGLRLDKALGDLPGIVSREMARRLILQGAVVVNGRPGEPSTRLRAGDAIAYRVPPPQVSAIPAEQGPLAVLYEDAWLIVIDKPPGLAMHPAPGHRSGTLVNLLLGHCTDLSGIGGTLRPGIVHRLDMDTSGVVVAAKTDAAHQALAAQFKARTIQRLYTALVVGRPPGDAGTIDLPVDRHRANRIKRAVMERGKRAVTHWRVLARLGPFTQLALKLETGRTHQIRVHLAHQDWPVLGDPLYGLKRHRGVNLPPRLLEPLETFRRQALHAAELEFEHPASGERLAFRTPPPPDMQALLSLLQAEFGG